MHLHQLIKMANQIEAFFRSDPDRDLAVKNVANHIQRFWDPRMRMQIRAHVEEGGEGLGDLAIAAIASLPPISPKWGKAIAA